MVSIPSRGSLSVPFITKMVGPLYQAMNDEEHNRVADLAISFRTGYNVAWQRNKLVQTALNGNADYVWFIDDDQIPAANMPGGIYAPLQILAKLLSVKAPIVSGLTRMKKPGWPYAAVIEGPDGKETLLTTWPDDAVVIDVTKVGMFCCLIKTEVFRKIRSPWFVNAVDGSADFTEDYYFCAIAKSIGYPIKVHTHIRLDHLAHPSDFTLMCDDGIVEHTVV